MNDALSEVIRLLQPSAVFAKQITGADRWAVTYSAFGQPSFCVMLEGRCTLKVDGHEEVELVAGDFVLMPATPGFTLAGAAGGMTQHIDATRAPAAIDEVHHGTQHIDPDVRMLGGYFVFGGENAELLVSLLPSLVHVSNDERLATLVQLIAQESRRRAAGSEVVLTRLVEVMLIEALRASPRPDAPVGLLRGLADARLAAAIERIHGEYARPWTVAQLARAAALSRSAFFDRFARTLGVPPMEYLLAWRMAVAKDLLQRGAFSMTEVARRVGYGSASTFSTAFSRHVGQSPGRYARTRSRAALTDDARTDGIALGLAQQR